MPPVQVPYHAPPWFEMIFRAEKIIEFRLWSLIYKGPLAIYASTGT